MFLYLRRIIILVLLKIGPTYGTVNATVIHITNDPHVYGNNCSGD